MTMTETMRVICGCAALMLAACNGKSADDDSADLQSCEGADCDDGGDSQGGDEEELDEDEDGRDGAPECDFALDCAFACDPDEACALECGEAELSSDRKAAFEALVTCMADAGCGFNEACLDASCEAEFQVFDALCT